MSIGLLQSDWRMGDCRANAQRLAQWINSISADCQAKGVELLITPELSLCGYCPEDWLLHPQRWSQCPDILSDLARQLPTALWLLVGYPAYEGGHCYNAVALLAAGTVRTVYRKQCLPNTGVFDEQRYFLPGTMPGVITLPSGMRVGIGVCEDIWSVEWLTRMTTVGMDYLVVMNASPYERTKYERRQLVAARCARTLGVPVAYCNAVGTQDEWIFDGRSFVMNPDGVCVASAPAYIADCLYTTETHQQSLLQEAGTIADVYQALCFALSQFMSHVGATDIVLGLSGGIDSALVLSIAVDVLGPAHCHAMMMYTPFTSDASRTDAASLAECLGVSYQERNIWPLCTGFMETLTQVFGEKPQSRTQENVQARMRMMLLMAWTNQHPSTVLLGTSNKSELMTGYGTLYGDLAGSFTLLKDIVKADVYALAAYRNTVSPVIPERVITRPPSAELAPGQQDSDELPAYPVIDAWIARIMACEEALEGADSVLTARLQASAFKRFQAPLGPKITDRALGKDWRYPLHYHVSSV